MRNKFGRSFLWSFVCVWVYRVMCIYSTCVIYIYFFLLLSIFECTYVLLLCSIQHQQKTKPKKSKLNSFVWIPTCELCAAISQVLCDIMKRDETNKRLLRNAWHLLGIDRNQYLHIYDDRGISARRSINFSLYLIPYIECYLFIVYTWIYRVLI